MAIQTSDFTHQYIPSTTGSELTLLMLHGTGGDENALIPLGHTLAPGAALLSPRGKTMEGPNPRFFKRTGEGVYDMVDLMARTEEIADWIEAARETYGIAAESLIAVGFSNGANIAASVLIRRPGVLQKAILIRAMMPIGAEERPVLTGTKVLLLAGMYDRMVPQDETRNLAQALERFGANVALVQQPADHGLTSADIAEAQAWIQRNSAG